MGVLGPVFDCLVFARISERRGVHLYVQSQVCISESCVASTVLCFVGVGVFSPWYDWLSNGPTHMHATLYRIFYRGLNFPSLYGTLQ